MKSTPGLVILASVALFAACGHNPPRAATAPPATLGEEQIRQGAITRIDPVQLEHSHQLGLGAVLGAVVGGVVGKQIGRGSGRDVATVLGVIAGGAIAHHQEEKYEGGQDGQHILVELNNGVTVGVTQRADASLRVGDAVAIQGAGQAARVVRR